MEKLKTHILNTYNLIPAPIYGMLSAATGLGGDIIAIALFPNYNFNRMISALGAGPGAIYFNIGTIFSGIFALLFYLYMIKIIGKKPIIQNYKKLVVSSQSIPVSFFR